MVYKDRYADAIKAAADAPFYDNMSNGPYCQVPLSVKSDAIYLR